MLGGDYIFENIHIASSFLGLLTFIFWEKQVFLESQGVRTEFQLYHRTRKKGIKERWGGNGPWLRVQGKGSQSKSLYLEHGPILEDMLLITHHTVLIQCWNSLLCILHDLGREEILLNLLEAQAQIWELFWTSFPATLLPPSPVPRKESFPGPCT